MELFCILENDIKTFNIIKRYIKDEEEGIDLFKEDLRIQLQEILEYQYLNGKNGCDWGEKYGEGERIYLNMLKEACAMLRFFEEFQKRLIKRGVVKFSVKNLSEEDIKDCCEIANFLKLKYLDKIYLGGKNK